MFLIIKILKKKVKNTTFSMKSWMTEYPRTDCQCGVCGQVVKLWTQDLVFGKSRVWGSIPTAPVTYKKSWASFESTLHLASQQKWVPGAQIKCWIGIYNCISW